MDLTPDFWTPMKHWAALWILMRHHLPWGVAFLCLCPSQIKLCFVSSHSLRPVVGKTGNLSNSNSSTSVGRKPEWWCVLFWEVPVQSNYNPLLFPLFFFSFIFLCLPFFPFLSLSLPVPTGSLASNGQEAQSENLRAAPYLTAAVKTTEVE